MVGGEISVRSMVEMLPKKQVHLKAFTKREPFGSVPSLYEPQGEVKWMRV